MNELNPEIDSVSSDAVELDRDIKSTIRSLGVSILSIGIGLARVKALSLFKELNFKNMTQYIKHLSEETKFDRSCIFNWLYIGEAYVKYREELEKIGFGDRDGPTKLPYLSRALQARNKKEVFDRIKTMSAREFKVFSKGEEKKTDVDTQYVEMKGNVVFFRGKKALIVNSHIDKKVHIYFMEVIKTAIEALDKGGIINTFFFHNRKEANRFDREVENIHARILMRRASYGFST